MAKRFIDYRDIIGSDDFIVRQNFPLFYRTIASLFILAAISFLALHLFQINLTPGLIAILALSFTAQAAIICYSLRIASRNNTVNEFQNALFSGIARMSTDFCVILRYDGRVFYISPEYQQQFLHHRNDGLNDFEALCRIGKLDEEQKKRFERALATGEKELLTFSLPHQESQESRSLTLEPVGVYKTADQSRKLRLAVHHIDRPSGFFFLRTDTAHITDFSKLFAEEFATGYYQFTHEHEITHGNRLFSEHIGLTSKDYPLSLSQLFSEQDLTTLTSGPHFYGILPVRKPEGSQPFFISHYHEAGTHHGHGILFPLPPDYQDVAETPAETPNQFPDLFDTSPIATAIISDTGNIKCQNQAFDTLTQKHRGNLLTLLDENSREDADALITSPLSQNFDANLLDVKFAGDDEKMASLYCSQISTEGSAKEKHLLIHLIDTTELKSLELRVVHSQKMQAVGQLAGGIAHDFNNLLTAMIGFCDLLLIKHPAGDSSFADIMQIKQNANRAANLIKQLLAFSRKQTLQPEVINLTDVLADLSNLIRRLIGENISLNMTHGRDIGYVKVDQAQLEQVIINLAVNARDAMNDGGTLIIETKFMTIDENHRLPKTMISPAGETPIEPGDYVLVEVIDTGTGIPKDIIEHIFDPFYSTKEATSGTGLGLATVYGIIKQTKGYIYVSSDEKQGTLFSIFLKSYSKEAPANHQNQLTQDAPNIDLTGNATILLVEDETPVRIFSCNALKNKGYTVHEADCAEAALEVIKAHGKDIDIIISDVVMPGMKGPDMVKEIREEHPALKVIFISGYGEDAFISTYGDARDFHFLSKPYTLKQLATKVKEVLSD